MSFRGTASRETKSGSGRDPHRPHTRRTITDPSLLTPWLPDNDNIRQEIEHCLNGMLWPCLQLLIDKRCNILTPKGEVCFYWAPSGSLEVCNVGDTRRLLRIMQEEEVQSKCYADVFYWRWSLIIIQQCDRQLYVCAQYCNHCNWSLCFILDRPVGNARLRHNLVNMLRITKGKSISNFAICALTISGGYQGAISVRWNSDCTKPR